MLSYSKIFSLLALSFILGVALASFLTTPHWLFLELFFLGIFYALLFHRRKIIVVFGFCLVVFALGMWRIATEIKSAPETKNAADIKQLAIIEEALPSPQAELLIGILFGERQTLDYQWKKKMNLAGVRHITAVSGANIIFLSQALVWFLVVLGFYRQRALLASVFLVWFYVFLIAWPASAVRAGIMASLLLLAGYSGRPNRAQRTIVLAGAVMLAVNPLLLRFDIGFQLSFLAALGLIYLAPLLRTWFRRFRALQRANVAGLLAVCLSAWLFTLPLSVYYFGYFSPMAVIANLLIAPLIPLIMFFGFLLLSVGSIYQALTVIFAWPAGLLLNCLLKAIDLFSPAVLANWQFYFSKSILAVCYSGLAFWIWRAQRQGRQI